MMYVQHEDIEGGRDEGRETGKKKRGKKGGEKGRTIHTHCM